MGDLPQDRSEPQPPFQISSVDYAGPFMIKNKKGCESKISEAYVSLFICFMTKAIELESVSDLSKDAFVLPLRRFISRREKPKYLVIMEKILWVPMPKSKTSSRLTNQI